jgi:hypothetical protein
MHIINPRPILDCTLGEFWDEFLSKQPLSLYESKEQIETTFRGQSTIKPKFRIPSAGGQSDVFFDNREMLCRFANFPTPTQERFLCAVRQAMMANNVREVVLTIPWSATRERKLRIVASGLGTEVLDFELLT